MLKFFGLILLVLVSQGALAAETLHLKGVLHERGTRKAIPNVNIYCFAPADAATPLKATTDSKGNFAIDVPADVNLRWRVAVTNYQVLDQTETAAEAKVSNERRFLIEKQSYLTYETTVYGQGEKRDDKTKTLTQDQFLTLPGSNGDPVKAVQNLPGVNRGTPFSAQVIIEGSAPEDTKYSINTQPVPIIFHFGGISSVVIPEGVDRVDYLSAGYGPEFGQSTAGLVNLYTKDPRTDRDHGMAYVDIFNAGGLVEGPINDHSSYMIGLRKSYIGQVLKAAAKGNSDFNLTVAPDFDDLVLEYENKLSANDTFKLTGVGSIDTMSFVLTEPVGQDPAIRGGFDLRTQFYRFIPEYTHKINADNTAHFYLGIGQDDVSEDIGNYYYRVSSNVLSGRGELESQLNPAWKSYLGVDTDMHWEKVDFQVPYQSGTGTPVGVASLQTSANDYFVGNAGAYWRNVLHPSDSRWTFLPGLRVSTTSVTHEVMPEPRLAARYALDQGLTLRGATGMYDEAPHPENMDSFYGNPNLKSERAAHFTLGAEKDFRGADPTGWVDSVDVFYKYLYDLVESTPSTDDGGHPVYYDNNGSGRVYGAEFLLKYQSKTWSGWLSYTYSKSTRDFAVGGDQLFQYDQTHNLMLVAEREFGHNWKFSGRARYTTGNPYTPDVGGTYDADNDVYVPQTGGLYSERLAPFFEVDVRFDKKWVYDGWIMTGYLDVENVTNNKNPEALRYSYNYKQSTTVNGLPMLPTIGVKGEF